MHGETADSIQLHYEWLQTNGNCSDEQSLRPRWLATDQERQERSKSMALSDALLAYPFLATEVSVCLDLLACVEYVVICALQFKLPVEFKPVFQRSLTDSMK